MRDEMALWRNADLLRVLVGEGISDVGSRIGELVLPLIAAVSLDASPGQMAALLTAEYLPRVAVGLLAAGWIDRLRRRPVLIGANVARAMVLGSVALGAAGGVLRPDILYVAGLILAGLDVVFTSAFTAYLPTLVSSASLTSANAARATSSAAADVLGPAAAGALISAFGVALAVAIDAVSFLASVAGLVFVAVQEPRAAAGTAFERNALGEILEGWHTLMHEPRLRALAATAFTANFFYRVVMAVYVLYLARNLGLSPAVIGVIFGLGGGLGVLIGSAAAAPIARRFGTGRTMLVAHLLFGICGLPLALSAVLPAYGAALVFASEFAGLAVNAVYMVNRTTLEQVAAPDVLRGRIQTCNTVVHAVAGVLGLIVGGVLGEQFGPAAAVVIGVLGGLFSFIWLWVSPIRGADAASHVILPSA